jgi:nucleoside 2-deoxyribosyltransferase
MGLSATMPRVYLAGPGVFREDAASFGKMLQEKCSRAGLDGCYPLGADIALGTALETARAIYRANVALIDSASAIIADISPFRGPNMDQGTAWEIGYGIAKDLPVYAWSTDFADLLRRTQRHAGTHVQNGRAVDEKGWTIEDFGLIENLMIAVSCTSIHRSEDEAISACAAALTKRGAVGLALQRDGEHR